MEIGRRAHDFLPRAGICEPAASKTPTTVVGLAVAEWPKMRRQLPGAVVGRNKDKLTEGWQSERSEQRTTGVRDALEIASGGDQSLRLFPCMPIHLNRTFPRLYAL